MLKYYFSFSLLLLICISGVLALSCHVFILQYFQPPILHISDEINSVVGIIIHWATVISAILLYWLSDAYWEGHTSMAKTFGLALLILMLTEQLIRMPLMSMLVGISWKVVLLTAMPIYMVYLLMSAFIVGYMPLWKRSTTNKFLKFMLFSVALTFLLWKVKPYLAAWLLSVFTVGLPLVSPVGIMPPYPISILVPAYLTFIEPTVAMWISFFLIKHRLAKLNFLGQGLMLSGLLILMHGGIYSFVQIALSEGNLPYRIFYYGQFLWEYLVLGCLTAAFALLWEKYFLHHLMGKRL